LNKLSPKFANMAKAFPPTIFFNKQKKYSGKSVSTSRGTIKMVRNIEERKEALEKRDSHRLVTVCD